MSSVSPSPHLEFMGWTAEPQLLDRLLLHWVTAVLELGASCCQVWLTTRLVQRSAMFIYFLAPPLFLLAVKVAWTTWMGVAYLSVRGADYVTAVKRMGVAHSRSFWEVSSPVFSCMSWLLLLWYFLSMVFVMGSSAMRTDRAMAIVFLGTSATFLFIHWAMLIDCAKSGAKEGISYVDELQLEALCRMFRSQEIRLSKFAELARKDGRGSQEINGTCSVCLEDFGNKEQVAQLPCGHTFHPGCVHKWLRQDWRCPLRCELSTPMPLQTKPRSSSPEEAGGADLEHGAPFR